MTNLEMTTTEELCEELRKRSNGLMVLMLPKAGEEELLHSFGGPRSRRRMLTAIAKKMHDHPVFEQYLVNGDDSHA